LDTGGTQRACAPGPLLSPQRPPRLHSGEAVSPRFSQNDVPLHVSLGVGSVCVCVWGGGGGAATAIWTAGTR